MKLAWQAFQTTFTFCLMLVVLSTSSLPPVHGADPVEQYTRSIEFDYISWTVDALLLKLGQSSLDVPRYLTVDEQCQVVKDYLNLVQQIDQDEYQEERIYADPSITDKAPSLKPWQDKLAVLRQQRSVLGPVAEEIFQKQINYILDEKWPLAQEMMS